MDYKKKTLQGDFENCFLAEFIAPDSYKIIRTITADEVRAALKANDEIFSLLYYERKSAEIYFNYDELRKTIDKYIVEVSKMKSLGLDSNFQEEMYVNVNSAFINFITSFVNFVNTVEQRRYGKDPHLKSAFKSQISKIYDKHFSYKLFYNLRNYALHYDYPIDNFKKICDINPDDKTYNCRLEINFDRDKILSGKVQKDLKTELKFFNTTFPLASQLQSFQAALKEVIFAFWTLEKPNFEYYANDVLKLASECSNRFHAIVGKQDNVLPKINSITLPVKIVERINSKFYN